MIRSVQRVKLLVDVLNLLFAEAAFEASIALLETLNEVTHVSADQFVRQKLSNIFYTIIAGITLSNDIGYSVRKMHENFSAAANKHIYSRLVHDLKRRNNSKAKNFLE